MDDEPLIFDVNIAKDKPNSYHKTREDLGCPFCQVATLTDIYERQGEMIWLRNKFPTLQATVQTVLIESSDHNGDITTYTASHNRELMHFALKCYRQMVASEQFKSVLWYKNFGPNSSGSLTHPHMQLVGLKKQDGYRHLQPDNYKGISLFNNHRVEVNVATHPVHGYVELNFNLLATSGVDCWADWIQSGAKYLLNVLSSGRCDSYNLFFYPLEQGGTCAKLIARFPASAYFVGYKLSQVDDEKKLNEEAKRFKQFFANGSKLV
ncbi:DUF4931 domain-containing protein [Lactobacillus xylocopicola]|uniref:DUF4931 domain-containing protein n=1 Tax=Lactobacillus xylocopicola TaxID=2976676 RepID=A0ABM8BF80_9LACO|nr:DUF4931 domain-containing protein [Lactobacillus xylocopicola]BDR59900.1 DUF4931 domain-containing protein [Lactobacillus xylocopicola]